MRTVIAILYVVSVLLPLAAIFLGALRARRELRKANTDLAEISRIFAEEDAKKEVALAGLEGGTDAYDAVSKRINAEQDAELAAAGFQGHMTWNDMGGMKNLMWASILRHAVSSFKPEAALLLGGMVLGGVASVGSLYLPA